MEKLPTLLHYQNDLSERICKARINFKKSPLERINKNYVVTRLETLEQLWSEFRLGHRELMQQTDPQLLKVASYMMNEVYDKTEEEFIMYTCELKDQLEPFLMGSNASIDSDSYLTANTNQNELYAKSNFVKLPKISIPVFSGKYTEWTTFNDLFVSMNHKNESLDNVQKLQYLKSYLTGEAEQLIRYIPVTEVNYEKCWQLLKERYSNKKYLSHCILQRFLSQKSATTESASFLKELMDTSSDCLNALNNLGIDVSTWDTIVIHLLSLKLDPESRKQWELNVSMNTASDALPTYGQLKDFLTSRYRALEFIEPEHVNNKTTSYHAKLSPNNLDHTKVLHVTNVFKPKCELCNEQHKVCFCKKFAKLNYKNRHEFVTNNRLCYNCLGSNHSVRFCQKNTSCRICKKKHHSLLHFTNGVSISTVNSRKSVQTVERDLGEVNRVDKAGNASNSSPITSHIACSNVRTQVLLATALVEAEARRGYQVIRALLDQGSQASFVNEDTVRRLGLKRVPIKNTVSALGSNNKSMVSKYMVSLKIRSRTEPNFELQLEAYVLNNITTYLPETKLNIGKWDELKQLRLADPACNIPNKVDVLLGAEVYCQILKEGLLRAPMGSPVAQCTAFGWILSGPVYSETGQSKIKVFHAQVERDVVTKQVWKLESDTILNSKLLTGENKLCEDVFVVTTRQAVDKSHAMKPPFRDEEQTCKKEESCKMGEKEYKNLEGKFGTSTILKERYKEVRNEYSQSDHLVTQPDKKNEEAVYSSYYAIIPNYRTTNEVVNDASCKNQKGVPFNDTPIVESRMEPELLLNRETFILKKRPSKEKRLLRHEIHKQKESNENKRHRNKRVTRGRLRDIDKLI